MRDRFLIRAMLTMVVVVGLVPAASASQVGTVDPGVVLQAAPGSCFQGEVLQRDCGLASLFADDWVLAGAAQDAQIMAGGGVATNGSCGGYYLERTFVSRYDKATFESVYQPGADGVSLGKSSVEVPSGFHAFDITGGPHDAYGYMALLHSVNDPQVAGIAAPIYVLTASPVPRAGPGTMPVPADAAEQWTAPAKSNGTGTVVVFDTTTDPGKMDVSPVDGWIDATAGHATFIGGLLDSAYTGPVTLVDATDDHGLFTEAQIAVALADYKFSAEDVANLSAGTYACTVGDRTMYPLLLANAVAHLDDIGVHLVAAAGNDATTEEFYPAAWGVDPTPVFAKKCPAGSHRESGSNLCMVDRSDVVTSVGSVSNSTSMVSYVTPSSKDRSAFSNYGSWVEAWAVGESLVSTYPAGAYSYCVPTPKGSCEEPGGGEVARDAAPSAHLDVFVEWAGTSFAAPQVATWIAGGNQAP